MSKEDSFKLLDAYYEDGGNFIDTAVSSRIEDLRSNPNLIRTEQLSRRTIRDMAWRVDDWEAES